MDTITGRKKSHGVNVLPELILTGANSEYPPPSYEQVIAESKFPLCMIFLKIVRSNSKISNGKIRILCNDLLSAC